MNTFTYTVFKYAVSVNEPKAEINNIAVYPNSTKGKIEVRSEKLEVSSIEIYNVQGKEVYHSAIVNQQSQIDLSSQPDGIYFVRVQTEQGIVSKNVVVLR